MRAHSSLNFPWNMEEKLVPNFFFREYNLYFKKTLNPFKVVYHPVSCLLHLHICRVAGENWKKVLPVILLSYQRMTSSIDVAIIFQLFRRVRSGFSVNTKGGKQQSYKKRKQSDILKLLPLLSADAKSAVVLMVPPPLTKVEVRNFPLLHFPRSLYLIAMSLQRVKESVIYKSQCFCLFDNQKWSVLSWATFSITESTTPPLLNKIQLSVDCYVSILNFHSLKY